MRERSIVNKYQISEDYARFVFENVIAQSETMMKVFELMNKILELNTTVLIHGETGTGKELLANVIHFNSRRREQPFVTINCAAIPDELFESELFGFKKGAFTGASEDKRGLFQTANGGTILFDEIGDMPFRLQPKLLRVIEDKIEDKKVMSLGSEVGENVDARIIATTNRDLSLEVEKGNFREDLFYRLNIIPIKLPPLRERKEDIPLLANFFLMKNAERLKKAVKSISKDSINVLIDYSWPGNVRELGNIIERAVILENGDLITDIESLITNRRVFSVDFAKSFKVAKSRVIEDFERNYISELLESYQGNLTQASRHAGMDIKNFYEKMKKYGIKRKVFLR